MVPVPAFRPRAVAHAASAAAERSPHCVWNPGSLGETPAKGRGLSRGASGGPGAGAGAPPRFRTIPTGSAHATSRRDLSAAMVASTASGATSTVRMSRPGRPGVTAMDVVAPAVASTDVPRPTTQAAARTNGDVETRNETRTVAACAGRPRVTSASTRGANSIEASVATTAATATCRRSCRPSLGRDQKGQRRTLAASSIAGCHGTTRRK